MSRLFLSVFSLASLSVAAAELAKTTAPKTNILILLTDEWRGNAIG